jgi:hypothetical protein
MQFVSSKNPLLAHHLAQPIEPAEELFSFLDTHRFGTAGKLKVRPCPSWTEERAEGYEPDCPSVYAQSNGEYSATQEVTGP